MCCELRSKNKHSDIQTALGSESRLRRFVVPAVLFLAGVLLLIGIHLLTGKGFFASSYYNTYTRQAMAWLNGSLHLPQDVPALELAVYEGEYYVSFPPVPSLILLPFVLACGMNTPDNLLMAVYILTALECFYFALRKNEITDIGSALWAYMLCFCGCILPLCLEGAVWYHAQILAFCMIAAACVSFSYDRPTLGCIFYALSVGCRPFDALFGLVLLPLYMIKRSKEGMKLKKLFVHMLPGLLCGLGIACAYGIYNWVRFGSPFEFGHNYLPEFSFQGGTQFSLKHVSANIQTFILGMPFDVNGATLQLKQFGFSMFIANPILLIMMVLFIYDLIRRKADWKQGLVILFFILHLFLLLLHRTFGGYQFGARYTCDLIPYAAVYLMLRKKAPGGFETAIGAAALIFSIYGTYAICL